LVSAGTLFVVATPLGNLGDLTARACEVLCTVPTVVAEDTRRTRILLGHVGASPRLLSVHAHSPSERLDQAIAILVGGDDIALVTDAGTPAVSDPGAALVRRARDAGVTVVAVPGPSAVAAALSISGMPADRYVFVGFPPRKGKDRRTVLEAIASSAWTCVAFEAPARLVRLLQDLGAICGADRIASVARELTKVHEELKTGTLIDLAAYYDEHPPRGEITVVVSGADAPGGDPPDDDAVAQRARRLIADGASRRDAASRIAEEFSVSRNRAYRIVRDV
jgi:16S rRNA (cytidine1402-2'-O)-methyltransferase